MQQAETSLLHICLFLFVPHLDSFRPVFLQFGTVFYYLSLFLTLLFSVTALKR